MSRRAPAGTTPSEPSRKKPTSRGATVALSDLGAVFGLERFDSLALDRDSALIRLHAKIDPSLRAPSSAQLAIYDAQTACARGSFHSFGHATYLRTGGQLCWRVFFGVPLDVVAYSQTLFELHAFRGLVIALPRPDVRLPAQPCSPAALALPAGEHLAQVLDPARRHRGLRRRTVALATALGLAGACAAPLEARAVAAVHHPTTIAPLVIGPSATGTGRNLIHSVLPVDNRVHFARVPAAAGSLLSYSTRPQPARVVTPRTPRPSANPALPIATGAQTQPASSHRLSERRHRNPAPPADRSSGIAPVAPPAPPAPPPVVTPASSLTTSFAATAAGTATLDSAGAGSLSPAAASGLSSLFAGSTQPPPFLIAIYKAAASRYDVPWAVLAAINSIETDYGRNLSISSAGAIGWMQFMPSTWAQYGVTANGKGKPNPYDPADAIFSAANYLQASGAATNLRAAIFAYNHAEWYVDEVMSKAMQIESANPAAGSQSASDASLAASAGTQLGAGALSTGTGTTSAVASGQGNVDPQSPTASAQAKVTAMLTTANLLNGLPYIFGGGHSSWTVGPGYDCSGFVSAVLHSAGYLSAPQDTQTLPSQPGILTGPGKWVTVYDRTDGGALGQDHVIINIDGQWWESGGTTSAGVHELPGVSSSYLSTFNLILHPAGL